MFTKSGSFAALLGVAVIAAGSLAECGRDAGRSLARQLGPQLPNPQEGFGPVSEKELRVREDGGRDLELSAESTRVRTWGDAGALLDPVGRCGEGRRITILSQEPGMENFSTDAPFPTRTGGEGRIRAEILHARLLGKRFVMRRPSPQRPTGSSRAPASPQVRAGALPRVQGRARRPREPEVPFSLTGPKPSCGFGSSAELSR